MVVVRESPLSKTAPERDSAVPSWPPASPFQALLSSPSGRKRWQDRQSRAQHRTPSPSPMRRPQLNSHRPSASMGASEGEEDVDDEDEEMLKLKLQRIEARLKLKQLQKTKKRAHSVPEQEGETQVVAKGRKSSPTGETASKGTGLSRPSTLQSNVQVPVSPKKEIRNPQEPVSPARRRLGLESVRATDVSLKRARDGTQLPRSEARRSRALDTKPVPRMTSFSERLMLSKDASYEQEVKQDRLAKIRSNGFGSEKAATLTNVGSGLTGRGTVNGTPGSRVGTIDSYTPSLERPAATRLLPSSLPRDFFKESGRNPRSGIFAASAQNVTGQKAESRDQDISQNDTDTASAGFDPFSQVHLSKRHHAHADVARELAGKEIYDIPRLFKEVVSPHYDPPECESDFVVFAILASKSSPYDVKSSHHTSDQNKPQEDADGPRNKFMVLHLTDLTWELDCFLFGSGFDQFWKLTPGTLLAILNPVIMPPKTNQHNGRFSLKLSSCEDKIMELGVARDLGFCVSKKKDGQQCNAWVDKRHTEICEFHLNLFVDKNRKHRMEVNAMWRGKPDEDWRTPSRSREAGGSDHLMKGRDKRPQGKYHAEYGQLYSIPNGHLKSAANLLDAEDTDALHNMSRDEASRKRIAAAQKERDLAKKLGEIGHGLGAEYLRSRPGMTAPAQQSSDITASAYKELFEKPSAADLGLLNNKATDQHLGPAKDRKRHFGVGAISTAGTNAMGWGGARTAGLLQPKDTKLSNVEKGQTRLEMDKQPKTSIRERSLSPKKRARFALEKGIREPGRESLGDDLGKANSAGDRGDKLNDRDDEDDLDIV